MKIFTDDMSFLPRFCFLSLVATIGMYYRNSEYRNTLSVQS